MTRTDISEALRAVADATPAPPVDRLGFQRQVAQERRRRLAARGGLGVLVAAASVGVAATVVAPFVGTPADEASGPAAPSRPAAAASIHLEAPVFYLADGELTAVDPQGESYELGLRSEEILGSTTEDVWVIGSDSDVVRFAARQRADGRWAFERADSGVTGAVQSAQLSADGRWLAWIDLDDRLHTRDLKSGEDPTVEQLPANSYLADLAQGSGAALVSEDGNLVLHGAQGSVSVLTAQGGYGWASTAAGDTVAVVDRDSVTRVYDVSTGEASLLESVPGAGYLAPYGDQLVSVSDEGDEGTKAWWWERGEEPVSFAVPGRPQASGWADDDTALVTSAVDGSTYLFGCERTDTIVCEPLSRAAVDDITLAH